MPCLLLLPPVRKGGDSSTWQSRINPIYESLLNPLEYDLIFKLILLAVLLVLSGFFSGSEASVFSLTPLHLYKMKEEKIPFSASVRKLLKRPRRLLVTIIAGNESINVAIAALTTSVFIHIFGTDGKWMAIAVASITLVVFCEAIPKTFAVTHPIRFSSAVALPLALISGLLRPMAWSLEKISDIFVSLFGRGNSPEKKSLTEDEFKALVDAGHQEGALDESQKDLIHRVFELTDTKVSDMMIPRVDMFCLPMSMNIQEVEREIIKERASRIPVYGTDKDNILGILHSKHLLAQIAGGHRNVDWHHLLKKPFFVPLEKRADEMLRNFQARRLQMAMVVDEYGGVAGLVTLNDILQNLFVDIYDDQADTGEMFRRISENAFMVSGMMDLEDFGRLVKIPVSTEDFDTAGGFVFHLFGKLPAEGEEVSVDNYVFRVEKISKARILTIRVTKREDPRDA